MISDEVARADLDQLAAEVNDGGVVELGVFDEAEILALGAMPLPRLCMAHESWVPFADLGLSGDDARRRAASHPSVQAAGRRLVDKQLATVPAGPQEPWTPLGRARQFRELSTYTNGLISWSSVALDATERPLTFNGVVTFARWSSSLAGVCLVETTTVDVDVTAATPLPTTVMACRADTAVAHIVGAVFREPMAATERDEATGTDCGLIVQHDRAGQPLTTNFRFQHAWGSDSALVAGGTPRSRRGIRRVREERWTARQLTELFEPMIRAFVDVS